MNITKNSNGHSLNLANALSSILNLKLVGPLEYLNGDLSKLNNEQILIHYRYHFDLPEFQTIIIDKTSTDNTHYGYWRDDPNYNPIGIVQSDGNTEVINTIKKCITPIASNLFYFIHNKFYFNFGLYFANTLPK